MIPQYLRLKKIFEDGWCDTLCPMFASSYSTDLGWDCDCELMSGNIIKGEYESCPLWDQKFDFDEPWNVRDDSADWSYIEALEEGKE